jgi:adenylate cyclase
MARDGTIFSKALAAERARNARQISAFRFVALSVVLALQALFTMLMPSYTGAPWWPLVGYVVAAYVVWRLPRRYNVWTAWSGYTIAFVDMPMIFWLVRASAKATVLAGEARIADGVLMILPLAYAGFILMASLALDMRQTLAAALTAVVFQLLALAGDGHDFTFLTMITAMTMLEAAVCLYWREQTVRVVRETADEQLRRERLGRYFSPQVASLLEASAARPVAERRTVTVLFADLRGFTKISEHLDSRDVVVLLNRFHSAMVEIVFAHGGTLDKYLGDGLMAYFGAPVAQDDQAERAVRCALGMQKALDAMNHARGVATEPLRMGIGVHTGPAVVGDIGAATRREFTVIGDTVNVAARLEQLTKELDTDIIVSAATVAATGQADGFQLLDTVTLRGRSEPVEVYAPAEPARQVTSAA